MPSTTQGDVENARKHIGYHLPQYHLPQYHLLQYHLLQYHLLQMNHNQKINVLAQSIEHGYSHVLDAVIANQYLKGGTSLRRQLSGCVSILT